MADLVTTLQELRDLDVGFVSLTEALDLITPSGRAMAGLRRSGDSSELDSAKLPSPGNSMSVVPPC
jgi:hypothetical protein